MSPFRATLILLILVLAICAGAEAKILTLNQTHGETWVKWSWALESGDYSSQKLLVIYSDGVQQGKYDLANTPDALVPTEYSLSDLKSDEQHSLRVVLLDNSTAPATLINEVNKTSTTSASSTYFFVILALGVVLFVLSLMVLSSQMVLIGLVLDVGSIILFGYLATAGYAYSPALSTISLILAVIACVPIIYALYRAYEKSQNWSD